MNRHLNYLLAGMLTLASSTVVAAPISIAFNTTSNNLQGPGNSNPSGEPSNAVGLLLPGQVGPWESLIVGSGTIGNIGAITNIFTNTLSASASGITFTLNTGGDPYETFNDPLGSDDLRQAVVFVRTGAPGSVSSRSGPALSWEITGLDDNLLYDLILFGQAGGVNPALFAIDAFDAGNGVGNPVTTDSEADGNFVGVSPTGGRISGTFSTAGAAFASWAGLQIETTAVPEPSALALAGLGTLLIGVRRRMARR